MADIAVDTVKFTTKHCPMCGKSSILLLGAKDLKRWQGGELVQRVWPRMSADTRELLITGTHPECWDKMFGQGEDLISGIDVLSNKGEDT